MAQTPSPTHWWHSESDSGSQLPVPLPVVRWPQAVSTLPLPVPHWKWYCFLGVVRRVQVLAATPSTLLLAILFISLQAAAPRIAVAASIKPEQLSALHDLNPAVSLVSDPCSSSTQAGGIICDADGNVLDVRFPSLLLTGSISDSISALTSLTTLDLFNNTFAGSIPPSISALSNLQFLSLLRNSLSGKVPLEVSSLVRLQILSLGLNQFNGSFPPGVTLLTALTYLNLGSNSFSGSLPPGISALSNLQQLYLDTNRNDNSNGFSGPLPQQMSSLVNLKTLFVFLNSLSGSLPSWISGLASLQYLQAFSNSFAGSIPSSISGLSNLVVINFLKNFLSADLPDSLSNLHGLKYLNLGVNKFTTSFPTVITTLTSLTSLNLGTNEFNGSLPAGISALSNLHYLYLDTNQFSGPLPASFSSLTGIQRLFLNDNHLTGYLPNGLSELSSLQTLSLSRNDFSGVVPASLGGVQNLTTLSIDGNAMACPHSRSSCVVKQTATSGFCQACNGFCSHCSLYITASPPPPLVSPPPPLSPPPPSPPSPPPFSPTPSPASTPIGLIVGIVIAVALLIIAAAAVAVIFWKRRRRRRRREQQAQIPSSTSNDKSILPMHHPLQTPPLISPSSTPSHPLFNGPSSDAPSLIPTSCKAFSLSQLQHATDGWSPANQLGSGGYGVVFKGTHPLCPNTLVAVKRATVQTTKFRDEVRVVTSLHHPHTVRLLGYCEEFNPGRNLVEQILVLEFVPNGDLEAFIKHRNDHGLAVRLNIMLGVASGLQYLHSLGIVHRDIKPQNVLLGSDWEAKLADFGLMREMGEATTVRTTGVMGTPGYVDPAYSNSRLATPSIDVYSFGILMLEVLTCARTREVDDNHIKDWALPLLEQANRLGIASALRHSAVTEPDDVILKLLNMAMKCADRSPVNRPTMVDVFAFLANLKTELYGAIVPSYAEQMQERVVSTSLSSTGSFVEDMMAFLRGRTASSSQGNMISQSSSSTQHSASTVVTPL